MTEILMTTWDGAGTTPPLMSVARALVARGQAVRVLADPVLRPEVEATGAEHLSWTRAPHRSALGNESLFCRDWEAGVQVVRSAPHAEVAAVVTHCGHGTTIKALAAGLPLVCLPMGRDQLDVAARVVHRGAGVRLDPAAEPEAIAGALNEVLKEPGYHESAERVAAAIAAETAHDRAVEEIEALIADRVAGAPA